jgi:predicted PurR-regulated permease PerM
MKDKMSVDARSLAEWLICAAILLTLLVIGRPLLVPFAFALLLWAILNALTDLLKRLRLPAALAWIFSLLLVAGAFYLVVRIFSDETSAMAAEAPLYFAKLQQLAGQWMHFLRLGQLPALKDVFSASGVADMLGTLAASAGGLVFEVGLIAVYVGFLLAEQRFLPRKLEKLERNELRRDETAKVIRAIANQVQTYLGVCTLLSVVMAGVTFGLMRLLGLHFAGFWALVMFFANYIPSVGGAAVVLPAGSALVQSESLGEFALVGIVLFGVHFVLANIVSTIMLGRTLNMSPLAIILSLSFWGLIWGVAGLFLAVPLTGAFVIICEHVDGLRWFAIMMAGPQSLRVKAR